MKNRVRRFFEMAGLSCFLACLFSSAGARACTDFVLADTNQVLFCNNEDWKAMKMRVWFVPSQKHYGCAYVGLVHLGVSVSEGGFNDQGLAFAWVGGYWQKWERAKQKIARGVPHERMLESCATVEQAIAFYTNYWEPAFRVGKMLVADRTGAWATLNAHDGRLEVFRYRRESGGFGAGDPALARMLPQDDRPTLTNALQILYAARAQGEYATRYSDVFDPKTGTLFLLLPGRSEAVTFNLAGELKRGPHFYDMARIPEQCAAKPKHLSPVAEWIKVIYCPLRYSRPSVWQGPQAGLHAPKCWR